MYPPTSLNAYWSILKIFLNNKKIACIPPIYHDKNYNTDFKEKAEILDLSISLLNHSHRKLSVSYDDG